MNKHVSTCLAVAILWISMHTLQAQDSEQDPLPKRNIFTTRIESKAPDIDGKLDEACWETVEWSGDYTQWQPASGEAPTQKTRMKVLYDAKNLYVGFRCFDDDPEKIEQRMSRRDGFAGDWVEVNIDSYHDLQTAFSFTISAAGVKGDEFISNDGNNWDTNWNPIWYAKSHIDSLGWTAELRIPLSQLRFGKQDEQVWGIQSTRRDFRMDERATWQPMRRTDAGWVSRFGELRGIKGLEPQKQLEIQPYVLAQLSTFKAEAANPFATGRDTRLSAGVDGRIGVTNDLTLDFTINPDFGQVEADPGALNLNGFQIFFNERRPFFIENRNIFDYQLTGSEAGGPYDSDLMFYSRRIGGSPHRYISSDGDRGYFVDQPQNTTILGAAKFSGKTRKGLSIGILESVTQREMATIDYQGERSEAVVEPLTNFFVGRFRQDFNEGNTIIGGMLTSVKRDINDPNLDFLHRSATSGGLDFVHRWNNRSWFLSGKIMASQVSGSREAIYATQTAFEHLFQRPDAEHLSVDSTANSLTGTGGTLMLGKYGGKWVFQTGATWRSPELELNDIGFLVNTDEINYFFWGARRWVEPFGIFRRFQWNYNHWSRWDFSGRNLYRAVNTNAHANFTNFWQVGAGLTYENLDISKNALRGGPALRRPNGFGHFAYISTDSRKKVNFYLNTFQGWGIDKIVRVQNYRISMNWQPVNAMSVSLQPAFERFQRTEQYVTQLGHDGQTRYINGRVDQQTFSTTIRLNYNITPDLTIQYYGQPFISRGRYDRFNRLTDQPLGRTFEDRFHLFTKEEISYDAANELYEIDEDGDQQTDYTFGQPDFNFIQFRSNLVLRWEYTPGSELFLVWSQGATAFEDPEQGIFRSLSDNLFGENARNIFLVKGTYRFIR
ncbi:DUF5916 domain-containing protein [Flavilitoribacter nigricans]|nr:DUF5916 domain-containing protein [Flavilitoribacter nigricans]